MQAGATRRIGLIVNPVAGMGGAVGLRGTDGADTLARAIALGAVPLAGARAARALRRLASVATEPFALLTGSGDMGAAAAQLAGVAATIAFDAPARARSAAHTRDAASRLRDAGVALIAFAGGDGTACDLLDAVGDSVPVLGIPCGVKMHSAVFAITPEAAGELAAQGGACAMREVVDRDSCGALRLFGYALVPFERRRLQAAKAVGGGDDDADLDGACAAIAEAMEPGVTYVLGPGDTISRILRQLGLCGTRLGIDAVRDGALVGVDLRADELLALGGPLRILVGVTGAQGFVLGRGNQPITPDVLRAAGADALIIVAGRRKLAGLAAGRLLVDTGDPALDRALCGYVRVRTGAATSALMRIGAD